MPTNKNKWMEELAPDVKAKPFKELLLPGSHDSGAYKVIPTVPEHMRSGKDKKKLSFFDIVKNTGFGIALKIPVVKYFIGQFVKTQNDNIKAQLDNGIRVLDLRLAVKGDKIMVGHGFYTATFEDVLTQIDRFLKKSPKEVIVLQIKADSPFEGLFNSEKGKKALDMLINKFPNQFTTDVGASLSRLCAPISTIE